MTQSPALTLVALAVLALAGCETAPPDPPRAAILVMPKTASFDFVPAPDGSIPEASRAEVDAFLLRWRNRARGPLLLQADGLLPADRARLLQTLAEKVRRNGGGPGEVALAMAPRRADVAVLSFQDFIVVPPRCDLIGDGRSWLIQDPGTTGFGCSTRTNIGAMVASPADIVDPALDTLGDAARGARGIAAYRLNQPPAGNGGSGRAGGTGRP